MTEVLGFWTVRFSDKILSPESCGTWCGRNSVAWINQRESAARSQTWENECDYWILEKCHPRILRKESASWVYESEFTKLQLHGEFGTWCSGGNEDGAGSLISGSAPNSETEGLQCTASSGVTTSKNATVTPFLSCPQNNAPFLQANYDDGNCEQPFNNYTFGGIYQTCEPNELGRWVERFRILGFLITNFQKVVPKYLWKSEAE